MKVLLAIVLALTFIPIRGQELAPSRLRFRAIDVFVDSGTHPLAAYQLDVAASAGTARIVGIEGGAHPAFKTPPYYDPKAIQRERVVLAAFNTSPAEQLPRGQTRVATIHVQIDGTTAPNFTAKVETAATKDGAPISVQCALQERNPQ